MNLTQEMIVNAMENIPRHLWDDRITRLPLFGMNIIEVKPTYEPKLKLSEHVPLSDEFRAEFNQWLLDQFGVLEVCLIPKNTVYMFEGNLLMRPEMAANLSTIF